MELWPGCCGAIWLTGSVARVFLVELLEDALDEEGWAYVELWLLVLVYVFG